jgi:hypothetical protein
MIQQIKNWASFKAPLQFLFAIGVAQLFGRFFKQKVAQ